MAAMPQRRPYSFSPDQTIIDFDAAPTPEPSAAVPQNIDEAPPAFSIGTGWIDTADRTRTWVLRDPHGTQMAEICTKRDAQKLADLLNRIFVTERSPTR